MELKQLTLLDKLILLSLDDDKGTFIPESFEMEYGISAALLLELALADKIQIENQKVIVANDVPIQDTILNEFLLRITRTDGILPIHDWIERFASHAEDVQEKVLDRLLDANILRKQELSEVTVPEISSLTRRSIMKSLRGELLCLSL